MISCTGGVTVGSNDSEIVALLKEILEEQRKTNKILEKTKEVFLRVAEGFADSLNFTSEGYLRVSVVNDD
jgi:hypothetical protein